MLFREGSRWRDGDNVTALGEGMFALTNVIDLVAFARTPWWLNNGEFCGKDGGR